MSGTGLETAPQCALCGSPGDVLHRDLRDLLYDAEGTWTLRRCPRAGCGLVWLDPRWAPADLWRAYRTYYTHGTTPDPDAGGWTLRRRLAAGRLQSTLGYRAQSLGSAWHRLLAPLAHAWPGGSDEVDISVAFLPAPPAGASVLDVGCGDGRLLARLRALGWRSVGHDVDPAAVDAAQRRGLDVTQGDLLEQRYPDASFDAAVMSHVIEHVYDPVGHLRECLRTVKPGGRLVLLTPNVESWGHRLFGRDWRGLEPPRHLHLFSRTTLRTVLERAGWRVVELRTLAQGARTIVSLSAAIRWRRLTGQPWAAFPHRQVKGLAYQLRERVAGLTDAEAGEELLAITERP